MIMLLVQYGCIDTAKLRTIQNKGTIGGKNKGTIDMPLNCTRKKVKKLCMFSYLQFNFWFCKQSLFVLISKLKHMLYNNKTGGRNRGMIISSP